ncbi:hypothetical protein HanIR_Chr09g0390861 [Helianthus annuus]|nr:hypothetical protein HanIR_Chr09g0390861 [Helianthus annuus]
MMNQISKRRLKFLFETRERSGEITHLFYIFEEAERVCSKILFKKVNKYVFFQHCLQIYTFLVCIFVVVCGSAIFLFKKMEVFKFLFYGFVVFTIDCINFLCKICFRSCSRR